MAAPGKAPPSALPAGRVAAAGTGNASLVLMLSLFLLLLVFFIVLNAQTVRRPERTGAVLASVERSFPDFAIDPRLRDGTDPVASRSGTVFAAERLHEMGELFATAIAVARVESVEPGRLLEVRLPADALFLPGSATLRPDRQGLIDRIALALRAERPGERMELDALLAIDEGAPSQPPGPVQRAGALARALTGDGAPAGSVTVGVERGAAGSVRFLFSLRAAGEGRR